MLLTLYTVGVSVAAYMWVGYETAARVGPVVREFETYKAAAEYGQHDCVETLRRSTQLTEEATEIAKQCQSNLRFCVQSRGTL